MKDAYSNGNDSLDLRNVQKRNILSASLPTSSRTSKQDVQVLYCIAHNYKDMVNIMDAPDELVI